MLTERGIQAVKELFSRRLAPHRPMPPPRASSHVLGETSDTRYGPAWGPAARRSSDRASRPVVQPRQAAGQWPDHFAPALLARWCWTLHKTGPRFRWAGPDGTAAPP